ncbi:hypothetical protein KJ854_02430 [Patescibacteria group bacterium]|nr:hypothetical protein [Patescibacteria group bacterium]MBU4141340.1 hypothetical protein [Patescibacteria group bacterium]
MSRENGLEKDINFKTDGQDPKELEALIRKSEETLSKLSGNAKKMMMETIETKKEKLEAMKREQEEK